MSTVDERGSGIATGRDEGCMSSYSWRTQEIGEGSDTKIMFTLGTRSIVVYWDISKGSQACKEVLNVWMHNLNFL